MSEFCHKCGSKVNAVDAFCSECGSQLKVGKNSEVPPTSVAEETFQEEGSSVSGSRVIYSRQVSRKGNAFPGVIAALSLLAIIVFSSVAVGTVVVGGTAVVLGVVAIVVGVVVFAPEHLGTVTSDVVWNTSVTNMALDIDCPVGFIDIRFVDSPSESVSVVAEAWGPSWASYSSPSFSNAVTGSNDTELSGYLSIDADDAGDKVGWHLYLEIDSRLFSDIQLSTSAGAINLDASNAHLSNLEVTAAVGAINADIGDNSAISGNIYLESTTGAVNLMIGHAVSVGGDITLASSAGAINVELSEPNLTDNITLYASNSVGAININWNQTTSIPDNSEITVQASTSVGAINFDMIPSSAIGVRADGHSTVGASPGSYESANYDSASSHFDISLEATTGAVNYHIDYL